MPVFHRSQRLKIYGSRVEITQLHNSRFEIVVRCTANNDTEAWYNDNKAQIFADFGTLYNAQMSIEGIDPRTGEAYPNMVLVQNEAGFTNTGDYVITFVYETLTDTFVQENVEKVDHELNGLRRVTRTIIAKSGTSYGLEVGVATITHSALGYGTKTLALAAVQEDGLDANEGGFIRLQETWVESGTLDIAKSNLKDGIIQVVTEFLVAEGVTVGPVISRSESNVQGLKTISVTTLQKKDGTSVLDGLDGNGVANTALSSHNSLNAFTYPGVVNLVERTIDARSYSNRDDITSFEYYLVPPIETLIDTETFVFVQTSSSVAATDKTYDSSSGLYNPTEWASTYTSGVDINKNPFSKTEALRGYRAFSDLDVVVTEPAADFSGNFLINGRPILNGNAANIGMKGGPSDPEGSKFVLDVTIIPAFETVDGTVAFKKRITTATIPSRTISYVPEGGTQLGVEFSSTTGRFSSSEGIGIVRTLSENDPLANEDETFIPTLQLDFNKAPANVSDLEHSCIAVVKGGASGTEEARVITDYNTTTKKITLSSGLTNFANYTATATIFYSLYGFNREGFISQNITATSANTEFLLDHTKTKIPKSTTYNNVFKDLTLFITAGTGSGTSKAISAYDAVSGKVTTAAFSDNLDATSKYRIGPA